MGFKHCFAVVANGGYWIMFDPRQGVPVLEVVASADYDLAAFYRNEGFSVIETEIGAHRSKWPVMASNCVGAVKAVLGLRSAAKTPYQLFKDLKT